jgi:hypothetical protein
MGPGVWGQRDTVMGEVKDQSPPPPKSWFFGILCKKGDQGLGRAGTCPHPACLPELWVPAIFGQKILPKLGDA